MPHPPQDPSTANLSSANLSADPAIFDPREAARSRLPDLATRRAHAAETRRGMTDRLGSETAAIVRLRALENFARTRLPAADAARRPRRGRAPRLLPPGKRA